MEPIRKYYISSSFLPSMDRLIELVDRERHLVLSFPSWGSIAKKEKLIESLKSNVPENFDVFNSGSRKYWTYITIKQVIAEKEVKEAIPVVESAVKLFRQQAEWLAKEISKLNDIPITSLWENSEDIDTFPIGWKCYHHGQHFCCENIESGQVVEVPIWFGEEFGVVDPYFLSQFIETTPSLSMPPGIKDWYHDMSKVFEIMLKKGSMKQINGTMFEVSGIVLT